MAEEPQSTEYHQLAERMADVFAECLEEIGLDTEPTVFLVVFDSPGFKATATVYTSPESGEPGPGCDGTMSEALQQLAAASRKPVDQVRFNFFELKSHLRKAVLNRFESRHQPTNKIWIASDPMLMDRQPKGGLHPIVAVMGFERGALRDVRSVDAAGTLGHGRPSRSLFEAISKVFFEYVAGSIRRGPRATFGDDRAEGELVRAAAAKLVFDNLRLVGIVHDVFGLVGELSAMTYEGEEGRGGLLFYLSGDDKVEEVVRFVHEAPLNDTGVVNKLLRVCGERLSLLCEDGGVIGLGVRSEHSRGTRQVMEVRILRKHEWEFRVDGLALMTVKMGRPSIPLVSLDREHLRAALRHVFPGCEREKVNRVVSVGELVANAGRGALMVVVEDAQEEAVRLERQCIRVHPTTAAEAIKNATRVDGAVIVGLDGMCYAFGAILDGLVCEGGTIARGAPYNAAVKYIGEVRRCVALVVSDDGMKDVLPELPPAVDRKCIDSFMMQCGGLADSNATILSLYEVMSGASKYKFYLTKEQCEQVDLAVKGFCAREGNERHLDALDLWETPRPSRWMNETFFK